MRPLVGNFDRTQIYDNIRLLITFSDRRVYRVTFTLRNTGSKTVILRSKLSSPDRSFRLVPGQVYTLNRTVPNQHAVFINVHDAVTNQRAYVNGKTVFLLFPKVYLVPYKQGRFSYVT